MESDNLPVVNVDDILDQLNRDMVMDALGSHLYETAFELISCFKNQRLAGIMFAYALQKSFSVSIVKMLENPASYGITNEFTDNFIKELPQK